MKYIPEKKKSSTVHDFIYNGTKGRRNINFSSFRINEVNLKKNKPSFVVEM